jgi:hypothetical protein
MSPECSTPPELHHMVVDCDEFGCGCADSVTATRAVGDGIA